MARWEVDPVHGGITVKVGEWTAREMLWRGRHRVRDRWIITGQGGEWRFDSRHHTALRRFAHLIQRGEWNHLTVQTAGVPEDIDDLWEELCAGYEAHEPEDIWERGVGPGLFGSG